MKKTKSKEDLRVKFERSIVKGLHSLGSLEEGDSASLEIRKEITKVLKDIRFAGKGVNTDLRVLYIMAKRELSGKVRVNIREHPVTKAQPDIKKLIGYFPTGEHQILFERGNKVVSCIRGYVSGGEFELFGVDGFNMGEPFRLKTERGVMLFVKKLYNIK